MKAYWNWNPFRELESLHRDLDRVFGDALPRWRTPFSRVSFLPGLAAHTYPLVNVREEDDALHAEALAPGIDPASLKITVANNQLTIAGDKPALPPDCAEKTPGSYHRNERADGQFIRSISLPVEVDSDRVEATYKNGVLRITLPKAEVAKPKQITVQIA